MLGAVYLLVSFVFGHCLTNAFLKSIRGLAKLAASYLMGIFFFTWLTFLLSLLFSFTSDPLRFGILGTLGVFLTFLLLTKGEVKGGWFKGKLIFFEFLFLIFTLVFSFWLMGKSFGYRDGYFRIASNIFDDFNVHLSIIRSFSLGKNFPPELPFFAGQPMKYHFLADFCFAIFEYLGWEIAWAVNLPSALAFTSLLLLIYSLAKRIFGSILVSLFSVLLFLFNSSLTWVKFFQKYGFSLSTPRQIWQVGQYLSAGPFDGGIISIFWNLNTFINQRHLIFGLGMFLLFVLVVLEGGKNDKGNKEDRGKWIVFGILLGLLPLWHGLIFLAAVVVILSFCLSTEFTLSEVEEFRVKGFWQKMKFLSYIFLPASIFALPQFIFLKGERGFWPLIRIGFLVAENLSLANLARYWFLNLGLACFTIPAGFFLADSRRKKVYLPFLALFILANFFQFSQNLFHNHSLLNAWIIISNFYSAYFLVFLFNLFPPLRESAFAHSRSVLRLFSNNRLYGLAKLLSAGLFGLMVFSGLIDLMVVKNDFLHQIPDYPQNKLMVWIKNHTPAQAVFLIEEKVYHPANLAGRKVFLGASHFVWGYGYDVDPRKILTNKIYLGDNKEEVVNLVRKTGVDYWLTTNKEFGFPRAYEDEKWTLYRINE